MIKIYNWLLCKLFKQCELELKPIEVHKTSLEKYCELNPWAPECRIYEV
jgi:hypothetical protein